MRPRHSKTPGGVYPPAGFSDSSVCANTWQACPIPSPPTPFVLEWRGHSVTASSICHVWVGTRPCGHDVSPSTNVTPNPLPRYYLFYNKTKPRYPFHWILQRSMTEVTTTQARDLIQKTTSKRSVRTTHSGSSEPTTQVNGSLPASTKKTAGNKTSEKINPGPLTRHGETAQTPIQLDRAGPLPGSVPAPSQLFTSAMELYRATRNPTETPLVSMMNLRSDSMGPITGSNPPRRTNRASTRSMVGLHQASKTQLDTYRRQIQQWQQSPAYPQIHNTSPSSIEAPSARPPNTPTQPCPITQPAWRTGLLGRLVNRFKGGGGGGGSTRSVHFQDSEPLNPAVDEELERALNDVVTTAGERLFGLDATELRQSPGVRHLVHKRVRDMRSAPDWIKLTGSLVCKKMAHWMQPNPSPLDTYPNTPGDSSSGSGSEEPLLQTAPPPTKKRRITRAIGPVIVTEEANPVTLQAGTTQDQAEESIHRASASSSTSTKPRSPKGTGQKKEVSAKKSVTVCATDVSGRPGHKKQNKKVSGKRSDPIPIPVPPELDVDTVMMCGSPPAPLASCLLHQRDVVPTAELKTETEDESVPPSLILPSEAVHNTDLF